MTELTITSLGQRGEGLAEQSGTRVFVPFTLPGERVAAELGDDRTRLLEVLDPSPDRALPFCPYFGRCGGCALQHAGPEIYAAFKREQVVRALSFAGIAAEVAPLVDARGDGRRRATLHARDGKVGYMLARSHEVIDITECPILVPGLQRLAPKLVRELAVAIGDCDVLLTATEVGIDASVVISKKPRVERLTSLAPRLRFARLTVNGELVFQAQPPTVSIGRAVVEVPASSFLQATAAAEEKLAKLVVAAVGPAKSVADLFSGVGPFALRMAETAKVFAADSDRPAIAALLGAVRRTRGLKPVTGLVRDLIRDPLAPAELTLYDAVVFDPPRAGAEGQSRELARSKVKTVVAVSCEPTTFARDAKILIEGGYRLDAVTPVDQFAWSPHVEVVGVFRR